MMMRRCATTPLLLCFISVWSSAHPRAYPEYWSFPHKRGCRNVELHIHFDGSFRPATLFHLAKKKGITLEQKTVQELADYMHLKKFDKLADGSYGLATILRPFAISGKIVTGDEAVTVTEGFTPPEIVAAYKKAYRLGIHRTVHAGETNDAMSVYEAVNNLHAERIGHGYAVVRNSSLYKDMLQKRIHFEVTPRSSFLTGGYTGAVTNHPLKRFAEDGLSFGLSTDDSMITGTTLQDEFRLAKDIGLTDEHIRQAQINAAEASFLPPDEKKRTSERFISVTYSFL